MPLRTKLLAPALLLICFGAPWGFASEQTEVDFYVSPQGKDTWSGRLARPAADGSDGPLATLIAARDAVRRAKSGGPIRVLIRGGTYRLDEPIVFTAKDSGREEAPITWAAYPGETPVISGGAPITAWKQVEGPLWTTVVPEVKQGRWRFRQLFVDSRRCTPARTPNEGFLRAAGPGVAGKDAAAARRDPQTKVSFLFEGEDIKPWANLDEAVVVIYHSWTTSRHRIKSLDVGKRLVEFTAPSGWPMGHWDKKQRYYVEAVREVLDAPGEWCLDRKTGLLTYYPRPGEDMTRVEVIAPRIGQLLRLEGEPDSGKFVEYLRFEGLSLQHTNWVMPRSQSVDGQAAAFLRTAAVHAVGARDCVFHGCEIARTGGYGLWLAKGCKQNRVEQCHLHDLGAGGVRIGTMNLPKQKPRQAEGNQIVNCFIHDGGKVYHAGVGVWIGQSSHNKIRHNEISDFLYTGVSVGWSWGYAPSSAHHNLIEYNHIHHLGWGQLSDMGGIYTLGVSPGTQLRYNMIHDVLSYGYGGWGLYPDEGSTGILLENNVVYRTKDGGFHQHYGRDNIVRNNVFAFSATVGQIRRSRREEHNSFTFERNIVYYNQAPLLGGNWSGDDTFRIDYNVYFNTAGAVKFPGELSLDAWRKKGHDVHSIVADPKFVDAEHFDFRLEPDSPAVKLGFKPIDISPAGLIGPPEWVDLPKQVTRPEMKMPGEP